MGYKITCCKCKKEIPVIGGVIFFVVQPTFLKKGDWIRTTFGGFKQLILCKECIFKKRKWIKSLKKDLAKGSGIKKKYLFGKKKHIQKGD